jgi:hypothetical protein
MALRLRCRKTTTAMARKHYEAKPTSRCFRRITSRELDRLTEIARAEREDFFARHPHRARLHRHRILCVALCQGAAQHFVNQKTGIKDIDVWTFYQAGRGQPYPYRRKIVRPFGDARFGRCRKRPGYLGRPVDLLGRSIPTPHGGDPIQAVREYLGRGASKTARFLRKKVVVLLEPRSRRGEVIWPRPVPR